MTVDGPHLTSRQAFDMSSILVTLASTLQLMGWSVSRDTFGISTDHEGVSFKMQWAHQTSDRPGSTQRHSTADWNRGQSRRKHKSPSRARRDQQRWEAYMAEKHKRNNTQLSAPVQPSTAPTIKSNPCDMADPTVPSVGMIESNLNPKATEYQPPIKADHNTCDISNMSTVSHISTSMQQMDTQSASCIATKEGDLNKVMPFSTCDNMNMLDCFDSNCVV